ncbi:hypothetical protein AP9108_13545 [Arthrospira sp. PCC 9108]|nr:hypothetical protein AP9108_13545 [Arthrospira sp. PCC 9108]
MDGWQWSLSGSRFYFTPSVPRFNPGVMIPKTGGGYRRYPDSLTSTYLFLVLL